MLGFLALTSFPRCQPSVETGQGDRLLVATERLGWYQWPDSRRGRSYSNRREAACDGRERELLLECKLQAGKQIEGERQAELPSGAARAPSTATLINRCYSVHG